VVSVMLISVLNIKVTCEWHKAIKLNYKNTRTTVVFVLRFPSTLCRPQLTVILWRQSYHVVKHSPRSLHYDGSLPGMCSGRVWRHGRRTDRGPPPRNPHFSMAIISITVQLCPFLLGHPVYILALLSNFWHEHLATFLVRKFVQTTSFIFIL